MGRYVQRMHRYTNFFVVLLSISMVIIADDKQDFQLSEQQEAYNKFYTQLMSVCLKPNNNCSNELGLSTGKIIIDQNDSVALSVCLILLQGFKSKYNRPQNNRSIAIDPYAQEVMNELNSATSFDPNACMLPLVQQSVDIKNQTDDGVTDANIPGAIPLLTLSNPIGVVGVFTTITMMLILDRLASKGCIDSGWSIAHMKEKIFGTPVYEGDEYYKNWRNQKNLERKFPSLFIHENALAARIAYEREMSQYLLIVDDLVEVQESLKTLPWADSSYERLLNFKFSIDPIYISENEELQLDKRLTHELANCRASALASIKEQIRKLRAIFDSLASEVMYQLKKFMHDFVKFKIDSKLCILLGVIVGAQCIPDESHDRSCDQTMNIDDIDLCCAGMNKKSITKLFTHVSEYLGLLEDFEKTFDFSNSFFQRYTSKNLRFIQENDRDTSIELIMQMIKSGMAQKQDHIQSCLQEITAYCKRTGQEKILPDITKYLKKISASRLKNYHKNIETRFQLHEIETLDIESLLSLFLDTIGDEIL